MPFKEAASFCRLRREIILRPSRTDISLGYRKVAISELKTPNTIATIQVTNGFVGQDEESVGWVIVYRSLIAGGTCQFQPRISSDYLGSFLLSRSLHTL